MTKTEELLDILNSIIKVGNEDFDAEQYECYFKTIQKDLKRFFGGEANYLPTDDDIKLNLAVQGKNKLIRLPKDAFGIYMKIKDSRLKGRKGIVMYYHVGGIENVKSLTIVSVCKPEESKKLYMDLRRQLIKIYIEIYMHDDAFIADGMMDAYMTD